jgi:hypothetical protein
LYDGYGGHEGKAFKTVPQGGGYHPNTSGTRLLRADETGIAYHISSEYGENPPAELKTLSPIIGIFVPRLALIERQVYSASMSGIVSFTPTNGQDP